MKNKEIFETSRAVVYQVWTYYVKDKECFRYNFLSPQKVVTAILRQSQIFESFTYGEQQYTVCTEMTHLKWKVREKQELLATAQPTSSLDKPTEHLRVLGHQAWRPVVGTHLCNCHAQQQEGWRDEEHSPRLGYLSKHMPEHDSWWYQDDIAGSLYFKPWDVVNLAHYEGPIMNMTQET